METHTVGIQIASHQGGRGSLNGLMSMKMMWNNMYYGLATNFLDRDQNTKKISPSKIYDRELLICLFFLLV